MEELLQQILEEQRKTNAYLEAASQAMAGLAGLGAALGLPTQAPDGEMAISGDLSSGTMSSGGFFGGN